MLRIISVNLNGIRAAASKGFFVWLAAQDADVVCVQELKARRADLSAEMLAPDGYEGAFHFAERPGYSGTGLYFRRRHQPDRLIEGIGVPEFDAEGRYIQADFGELSVVSIYVPSGSSSPERQAAKFRFIDEFTPQLRTLSASGRHVLLCGDWNVAHTRQDLKNWRSNQKNSGFLPEERAWLDEVFGPIGFVDVYRELHPEATGEGYTWWSNRGRAWENNVGWRIDYHVATPALARRARRAQVYRDQRFSDHAPLTIDYDYP
ncbi:MAG: exodeoxyribonuclease III [Gammaproteobacteria bacterium]|nr:exodeoxyribonuclease III [Gammaproteobacteria bacterium]